MFIRAVKTYNKKTGNSYVKHMLMESVRTENGPRQRTVMQLGKLELPQKDWPALVSELQKRLSGQLTLDLLDEKISRKVKYATDETMINLHMEGNKRTADRSRSEDSIEINLNDVNSSKHRSFGCEYVCHSIWTELGLPEKLKDSGFSERERSLAEAVVSWKIGKSRQ